MIEFTSVTDFISNLTEKLYDYQDGWEVRAIGTSSDNYFCFYLVHTKTGEEKYIKVPQLIKRSK